MPAGFGVFGVSMIYILTKNVDIITGFSLGASPIALFARVGGESIQKLLT